MCGLSAIYSYASSQIDLSCLKRLHAVIQSRGPDGEGFFAESSVGLAHRRLAIIDTSCQADQPFHWKDRFVLIFNGEIYNYVEIRSQLIGFGYQFRTKSDTEVLAAAFSHWGPSCQHRLNGMWAFVIWDRLTQQLFCSRDRFGIKPLYWAERDQQLFLASEPKQLLAVGIGHKVNIEELSRFLFAGVVGSTCETFFADIHSLSAGHSLTVSPGQPLRIERWY